MFQKGGQQIFTTTGCSQNSYILQPDFFRYFHREKVEKLSSPWSTVEKRKQLIIQVNVASWV